MSLPRQFNSFRVQPSSRGWHLIWTRERKKKNWSGTRGLLLLPQEHAHGRWKWSDGGSENMAVLSCIVYKIKALPFFITTSVLIKIHLRLVHISDTFLYPHQVESAHHQIPEMTMTLPQVKWIDRLLPHSRPIIYHHVYFTTSSAPLLQIPMRPKRLQVAIGEFVTFPSPRSKGFHGTHNQIFFFYLSFSSIYRISQRYERI